MPKAPPIDFAVGGMTEAPVDAVDEIEQLDATFADRLKRFVALEKTRRELETKLEDTKKRAAALSPLLLEDFGEAGLQNVKCGDLTCYIRVDKFVTKKGEASTIAICDLLDEIGRGDLVSAGYNPQSLKSWVLEQIEQRIELRKQIDGFIEKQETPPAEMVAHLAEINKIDRLLPMLNVGEVPRIVTTK